MRTNTGKRLAQINAGRQLTQFVSRLVSDALLMKAKQLEDLAAKAAARKEQDCLRQACELSLRQLGTFDGLSTAADILRLEAYHVRIDAGIEKLLNTEGE